MRVLKDKQFEIFCGTGGVGKTTLATSRALNLALKGRRVLLITIDPAKRLKQILGLENSKDGEVVKANIASENTGESVSIDAICMNPRSTLERLEQKQGHEFDNTIINALTRPFGGMNEILSLLEVSHHFRSKKYDSIILDTPPGKHFIDFLQAGKKIGKFFDKSFLEVFKYLGKKIEKGPLFNKNIFTVIVSTGIKKLLGQLEKVTGKHFVQLFVDALVAIYNHKYDFLDTVEFQEKVIREDLSNWYLVTSVEQPKIFEIKQLYSEAEGLVPQDNYLLVNKCLSSKLKSWEPVNEQVALKKSLEARESQLISFAKENFSNVVLFNEVLSEGPLDHVWGLQSQWDIKEQP